MANGIKKNWERVKEGWEAFGRSCKVRWELLGEAVDKGEWSDVFHHLVGGFLSDALQDLYRTHLYLIIVALAVYLGSLTGLYEWPLSWTGFL